ncbi:MAG TPA: glycosyltransferase family 39 protein [Ktedonobacterales bacterium]
MASDTTIPGDPSASSTPATDSPDRSRTVPYAGPSGPRPFVAVGHFFAPWHRRALALIALLAALCGFYQLQANGYANLYYSATVRSMLTSWHNFFFVSFDPGGFVTVDKPPLGFWVQAASAKLFGFSGFSVLLPEAVAGVLSVVVLYVLVRRVFGVAPGLLAALALAITPISVVTNRNNTIDSLLVLTVLLAAYAVSRAIERGSLRWLLLCALLIGLGFNIKMLEAYLVVPALFAVYLLGAPLGWWKRLWHLAVAGALMLAVSLSWVLAVDLTPASARPYVGSSGSNSELALALGYNGVQRLLGNLFHIAANGTATIATSAAPGGPGGVSENGAQGIFRLLNAQLGGQASWLLALGLVGILAAGWGLRPLRALAALKGRRTDGGVNAPDTLLPAIDGRGTDGGVNAGSTTVRGPSRSPVLQGRDPRMSVVDDRDRPRRAAHLSPQQSALVLWVGWTLTQVVFFSVAGFFHRYYLSMLAPGIAALAGVGIVLLWRDYHDAHAGWRAWLLPLALALTALTQAVILADYSGWNAWMTPLIVVAALAAAGALVWLRVGAGRSIAVVNDRRTAGAVVNDRRTDEGVNATETVHGQVRASALQGRAWLYAPLLVTALGVVALFIGPATWTAISLASTDGTLPSAGPTAALAQTGGGFPGGGFSGARGRFPGGFPGGELPEGFPDNLPEGFAGGLPGGGGGFPGAGRGGGALNQANTQLIAYLEAHQGSATYLFATLSSMTAAPYIIATGKPVMSLGGFSGSDAILTLSQLRALIRSGQVRYFLLSGGGGVGGGGFGSGPGGGGSNQQLVQWVEAHGTVVAASAYGGTGAAGQLYEVSSAAAG